MDHETSIQIARSDGCRFFLPIRSADGCGRHGRISVGGGGISIGHFHIQPSAPQFQRQYSAPYQQSFSSGYESPSPVIYQDPNSVPVVHQQPGQPQPFPSNAAPAGQPNPGFPGQPYLIKPIHQVLTPNSQYRSSERRSDS